MLRSEIVSKLKDALEMVTGKQFDKQVSEDMKLIDDMGLNSIGLLYIVIAVEELFSIRFEGVGIADFVTVKDVVDYIEKNID